MRLALRRTQKQVDEQKRAVRDLDTLEYRELQKLATERGISARQSADALREALK